MGFYLFGTFIPYYGFFILVGLVCASFLAFCLFKLKRQDFNDCIILSAYLIAAGFFGAKILFLIVSAKSIDWLKFFHNLKYFNAVISSGFVFYGGLICGIAIIPLVKKIHKIPVYLYMNTLSPCIALAHAFGRIGCAFAGCCYGKPTSRHFYFIYKESISAPNGTPLFPVQGIEAFFLFVFAITFTVLVVKSVRINLPLLYIFLYSIVRFVLEFFRGDVQRGFIGLFSTSQVISLVLLVAEIFYLYFSACIQRRFSHQRIGGQKKYELTV